MARTGSARRYAEAAFEIGVRDGTLQAWLKDLKLLAVDLGAGDAAQLLANPAVAFEKRADVVRRATRGRISPLAVNLVLLLVRRGRAHLLADVSREFETLYERREGIVRAQVTSAAPLTDDEERALSDRLGSLAGGTLRMAVTVDPGLLGGVIVRLGDNLIDGSVRGRLERLRNRLAAGTI
jgi:F-type H+-transporting ATPase subunit delta